MSSTDPAEKFVDDVLLDAVSERARTAPRRRMNHNLHRDDDPVHRLLNAIEPESYVPPHRHLDPRKLETIVVLRGRFGLVLFDENGTVERTVVLGDEAGAHAVEIPVGRYHSIVSLAPGSVFFETKAGPYVALSPAERAAWAPAEGEPGAGAYLESMRAHFLSTSAPATLTGEVP